MTLLQIMADHDAAEVRLHTRDPARIGAELTTRGVAFSQRRIVPGVHAGSPDAEILSRYGGLLAEVNSDGRYKHIDVARLHRDDNDRQWPVKAKAARQQFLSEHAHAEDEVRFFVAGLGCFYLHLEPEVVALLCEGGDLVSVPAGTRHWFDMGTDPDFAAIRFFEEEDGWIGNFTGDTISERFPRFDQLISA